MFVRGTHREMDRMRVKPYRLTVPIIMSSERILHIFESCRIINGRRAISPIPNLDMSAPKIEFKVG